MTSRTIKADEVALIFTSDQEDNVQLFFNIDQAGGTPHHAMALVLFTRIVRDEAWKDELIDWGKAKGLIEERILQ
jgi:hypothetical protein